MTTIYVVLSFVHWEGSSIVKAFSTEVAANAFRDECQEYHNSKNYIEDMVEWLDNHPAGSDHNSADGYKVQSIELVQE